MLESLSQAIKLIMQPLVELYILLVCLRILFLWANVSHANPILLMIERVTYPCLQPIYRFFPIVNGIDSAAVISLSALSMGKIGLLFFLQTGYVPPFSGLMVLALAEILKQFIDIFFFTTMLLALISWLHPLTSTALVEIAIKVGGPLLNLTQGVLSPISGIDFAPMLVVFGLQLLSIVIVTPLHQTGIMLIKPAMAHLL